MGSWCSSLQRHASKQTRTWCSSLRAWRITTTSICGRALEFVIFFFSQRNGNRPLERNLNESRLIISELLIVSAILYNSTSAFFSNGHRASFPCIFMFFFLFSSSNVLKSCFAHKRQNVATKMKFFGVTKRFTQSETANWISKIIKTGLKLLRSKFVYFVLNCEGISKDNLQCRSTERIQFPFVLFTFECTRQKISTNFYLFLKNGQIQRESR